MRRAKYWEIIADNLSKSRLELGLCLNRGSQRARNLGCRRRARHADEKLRAFVELECAIRACGDFA
jgi:hypothetical protein